MAELNRFRRLYLTWLIEKEKGELALIDADVMYAIRNNAVLSENIQDGREGDLSLGQKMANRIIFFKEVDVRKMQNPPFI